MIVKSVNKRIFLIIILIIIIAIGGWYFVYKKPAIAPGPQSNEFSDWKIYRNQQFAVEIKYPDNFFQNEPLVIGNDCNYQDFPNQCQNINEIIIANNLESRENLQYPEYWVNPQGDKVSSNNINFCLFKRIDAAAGTRYEDSYYLTVKNNKCVILRLITPYPNCQNYADQTNISKCEQDNLDKPDTINKVLSTFKFIE